MLPQLAVSAKILCLLMVVICGAVPSMVRSVRLYSQCSYGFLRIYPNGTVMAKGSDVRGEYQNLTISSEDFDLALLIYAPEVRRYLCFNQRWKLVGLPITKQEALRERRCQFREAMLEAYNTYRSVEDATRYVGFNSRGTQLRARRLPPARRKCRTFLKMDGGFSIAAHNRRLGGDEPPAAGRRAPRLRHRARHPERQPPPPPPPPRPKCPDKLRHTHTRHLRRKKFCDDDLT